MPRHQPRQRIGTPHLLQHARWSEPSNEQNIFKIIHCKLFKSRGYLRHIAWACESRQCIPDDRWHYPCLRTQCTRPCTSMWHSVLYSRLWHPWTESSTKRYFKGCLFNLDWMLNPITPHLFLSTLQLHGLRNRTETILCVAEIYTRVGRLHVVDRELQPISGSLFLWVKIIL